MHELGRRSATQQLQVSSSAEREVPVSGSLRLIDLAVRASCGHDKTSAKRHREAFGPARDDLAQPCSALLLLGCHDRADLTRSTASRNHSAGIGAVGPATRGQIRPASS